MQKYGFTDQGVQRWRCTQCALSSIRSRLDCTNKARYQLFLSWLTGTHTLTDIAGAQNISRQTLTAWFMPYWQERPTAHSQTNPTTSISPPSILICDGIYLVGRTEAVLIGRTITEVVSWIFAYQESYETWRIFFHTLTFTPLTIVCDGQKGLSKAISECFPTAQIQRCIAHIIRFCLIYLTKCPKTSAGQALRTIVLTLSAVRTRRQRRRWIRSFRAWQRTYGSFLKERTYVQSEQSPGRIRRRWWYTHARLRKVQAHIHNALPDMFRYVGHHEIPRTSNHVEGGINARIDELIYRHRGLSLDRKKTMIAHFLSTKQTKKPTRNFT